MYKTINSKLKYRYGIDVLLLEKNNKRITNIPHTTATNRLTIHFLLKKAIQFLLEIKANKQSNFLDLTIHENMSKGIDINIHTQKSNPSKFSDT